MSRYADLAGLAPAPTDETAPEPTSWTPVDLTDALDGADIPAPSILTRNDGVRLVYPGRTHQFAGPSESLKSWAAVLAAVQVLADGGNVLWIDFEDDERGVTARLRALGVARDVILERFVYVRPDEPLHSARDGRTTPGGLDFTALLARTYTLAVVDGVTEAMTTEGLDPLGTVDAATWMRLVPKRIANDTGAAVIVIDHVTKSNEPGRFALGSQHKLAGLTGAAYRFDLVTPFARAIDTDEHTGAVNMVVTKDRPGWVRARAREGAIGTLQLTSYRNGEISAVIVHPDTETPPELALMVRIAEYLDQYPGAGKNALKTELGGKAERVAHAIKYMIHPERLWLRIEHVGQSHRHYLTTEGRDLLS